MAYGANFGVAATYRLTDHWLLDADLVYERLLASAAKSPLVASTNQIGAAEYTQQILLPLD